MTTDVARVALLDAGIPVAAGAAAIGLAVDLLTAGEVVAIPTDTVYGLAASLGHPDSLDRIYQIKGRSASKSLPVLIASATRLDVVSRADASHPLVRLAVLFWPGGLTVALPARPFVPAQVIAPDGTVGVRQPDDPVALDILQGAGGALAVTSANRSGEPEATTAADIVSRVGASDGGVRWVIDAGPRTLSSPSTVAGLRDGELVIHREGGIASSSLRSAWQGLALSPDPV